jgi:hypothetical protein
MADPATTRGRGAVQRPPSSWGGHQGGGDFSGIGTDQEASTEAADAAEAGTARGPNIVGRSEASGRATAVVSGGTEPTPVMGERKAAHTGVEPRAHARWAP